MEFLKPNQFVKTMRAEGNRLPEDIWDTYSFEDLVARFEELPPYIREVGLDKELSFAKRKELETVRDFCRHIADEFHDEFLRLLTEYGAHKRALSPEIISYLTEKKMLDPLCTIFPGEQMHNVVPKLPPEKLIDPDNLIVVFQLPKPLARFWWKGGFDVFFGKKSVDVGHQVLEWGHFYQSLLTTIWQSLQRLHSDSDVTFIRLNETGEHDVDSFYYVWEVIPNAQLSKQ